MEIKLEEIKVEEGQVIKMLPETLTIEDSITCNPRKEMMQMGEQNWHRQISYIHAFAKERNWDVYVLTQPIDFKLSYHFKEKNNENFN